MEPISLANILGAISNENALAVFKTIADTKGDTDILRSKLNITRKQYYSRISGLLQTGLVKRKNGRYSLTVFGELVYDAAMTLEKAFNNNNYWKLKAIDSFEITPDQRHELSIVERNKIIETLLRDDEKIKDILIAKLAS
jgi:predicted transcriptional regulator